mmetsp:Transcript_37937/g.91521  ORF Transcript_37937/g.91521 Transcript_37937/m.91521 type:complete len:276 (-) Transcript_37937:346-1173(-)
MLHGQRPMVVADPNPFPPFVAIVVASRSLIDPKPQPQRRLLPLGNAPRPLHLPRGVDQRRLLLQTCLSRLPRVLDVRRALRRREVDPIRPRRHPPVEVEDGPGIRPLIPQVAKRYGHGARRRILHGHADPRLGTHLPVRALDRLHPSHAPVHGGREYGQTRRDDFLPRGNDGHVLIPSVPVVVVLADLAVVFQNPFEVRRQLVLRRERAVRDERRGLLALRHGRADIGPQVVQRSLQHPQRTGGGVAHGRDDRNVPERAVQFLVGTLGFGNLHGR